MTTLLRPDVLDDAIDEGPRQMIEADVDSKG
jgi:hypothetical protein